MLLYVHVPFCRQKCTYCSFFSQSYIPEAVSLYLKGLELEIQFWAKTFNFPKVSSIYFGGGTPSLLSSQEFSTIVNWIYKYFQLEKDLEFSLEVNPESGRDETKLKTWLSAGVNRISLGIQSFDPAKLKLLGRIHSVTQAKQAFFALRKAGVKNISIDLIFGLPEQSPWTWWQELKQAVYLKPEHISCYGLSLEPATPLFENKHKYSWPEEKELAKMYVSGAEYLEAWGYLQYEISNFAKMGFKCKHNWGYWQGKDFLGLGPSAVSTVKNKRWQNPSNLKLYAQMAEQGWDVLSKEEIVGSKRINEVIMLSLRTVQGLDLKKINKLVGTNFVKRYQSLIAVCQQHGLLKLSRGYLRLTKAGMVLSDTIIPKFFWEEAKNEPLGS